MTFQNPLEVTGIEAVSAAGVRAQIETVRKAVDLKAAKTGMLFSAEIIEAVKELGFAEDGGKIVYIEPKPNTDTNSEE